MARYTPTEYHIVIDNSNVFLGAQLIRNEKTGVTEMNPATRVNVGYLTKKIEGGQQVLVLVTGDGNTNYNRGGFLNVVEIALKDKWNVELWSWELSLSQRFFEIKKLFPTQLTIKYLDPHRTNITFEERVRQN
ncbi:unnamed protein product [Adineta steineri]|uniref:Uncharacterized protein n=1 Tax=Adineta steineri TaxID=433720 RepID=A0A815S9N5_9BILA|nr:unnamed protein product [Adineta steineri]CAF1489079.1 unnamed protein product [Adineta steineri]